MISNLTKKLLSFVFIIGQSFRISPYEWSGEYFRPELYMLITEESPCNDAVKTVTILCGASLAAKLVFFLLLQLLTFSFLEDLPVFLQQFLRFADDFEREFAVEPEIIFCPSCDGKSFPGIPIIDKYAAALLSLFLTSLAFLVLSFLLNLLHPTFPFMLSSLLPPKEINLWIKILSSLGVSYVVLVCYATWFTWSVTWFAYMSVLEQALPEIEYGKKCYMTKEKLRFPVNSLKIYKNLEVLHDHANHLFPWFVLLVEITIIQEILMVTLVTIRSSSIIVTVASALLPYQEIETLMVGHASCTFVTEQSSRIRMSWRVIRRESSFYRVIRSLQSLKVKVGRWYFVDREHTVFVLKIIANLAIIILLL
ncbi:unnamed protein product [Allacma fusca]|uniref:Uncharacterized protein n=1 Tax=Allacma fusca TaxID=39272 RepID=A0A8J2LRC2_9HEXA|nr:unnamed protein product [Allacma fusca]